MKRSTISVLAGVWVTGTLLFSGFPVGAAEGEKLPGSVKPAQTERDPGSNQSAADGPQNRAEGGLGDVLQFKAETRETTPPEREAETLRFRKNTVLERFQNADAHGQLVLSFSADGVELRLRSITGAEAPIVGMNRPQQE